MCMGEAIDSPKKGLALMTHSAITTLEKAIAEVIDEISEHDASIATRRTAIEASKTRLEALYKDRDNLIDALAMVRKRVGDKP